jgi:hypothetical protein
VKNNICIPDRFFAVFIITDVSFDKLKPGIIYETSQIFSLSCREIIEAYYLITGAKK